MSRRKVIEVPGLKHTNPIPLAARVGHLLATGSVIGKDPQTGEMPETLEGQCAQMFRNIRAIMAAAGGSTDDIVKLSFWLTDRSLRPVVNKEWLAMFPDENSRPARHTFSTDEMPPKALVQCEILAVLPEDE